MCMVTKIFLFVLIFCGCFLFRELIMFIKALVSGKKNITTARLFGIGLSIAYVLTIIFTGLP